MENEQAYFTAKTKPELAQRFDRLAKERFARSRQKQLKIVIEEWVAKEENKK
jgi:5-formaminoimidazole-4-carboxamide-1-beta-D-ribofuranosyl 5'-monophosphate synthetase